MLTNLEELRVLVNDSAIHTPIRDIIALPKLRRLIIEESNNATGRGKEFFAALKIPALAELTLEFSNEDLTLFPTSTSPLGNLTKLDIECDMNAHGENTQHLLNFLALTHRVEWLRIYDLTMTVEFVNGLDLSNFSNGASVRLPYLLFLDIGECDCVDALANDLDPLVDMLYSRLPGVRDEATKGGEKTDPVNQQSLVTASTTGVHRDERRPAGYFSGDEPEGKNWNVA
ncbi:hypothetical protein BDZ89DRAFT_1149357 [Hymenopellis radicata]|nr:hypothetical protein BDZ89DRAFT_1149357 [Hymenopellis radicata]